MTIAGNGTGGLNSDEVFLVIRYCVAGFLTCFLQQSTSQVCFFPFHGEEMLQEDPYGTSCSRISEKVHPISTSHDTELTCSQEGQGRRLL